MGKRSQTLSGRVLRLMSLFTGLQAFTIICSMVKMKLVAIWLQATGVGLFGICNNTIETIAAFTELGLRQSAVRDVALAAGSPSALSRMVAVVRRWSLWAGLLGAVVISGGSFFLSGLMFADYDHWLPFMLLSVTMLFNALLNGEQAILQGTGAMHSLAKASFWGTLVGLAISIPMFRFMGDASVVPSIIAYSAATLFFVCIFRFRPKEKIRLSISETFRDGKGIARMGVAMALAAFISNLAHLLFLAYLNRTASTAEAGYFQAGNTLIIRYVGLIFTAIGLEFYPRVSAHFTSRRRTTLFLRHEVGLLLCVVVPVTLIFLLLRRPIIQLLYTHEFMVIIPLVSWGILSSVFKAAGWCMGYIILAHGDSRLYMLTESIDAAIGLTLNIVLYNIFGLAGIGMAYICWFAIYCVITATACSLRYGIRLGTKLTTHTLIAFGVCIAGLLAADYLPQWAAWCLLTAAALPYAAIVIRTLVNKKSAGR